MNTYDTIQEEEEAQARADSLRKRIAEAKSHGAARLWSWRRRGWLGPSVVRAEAHLADLDRDIELGEVRWGRMRRQARRGPPTWSTGDAALDARLKARWFKIYGPFLPEPECDICVTVSAKHF
jgi:hypothetical protein